MQLCDLFDFWVFDEQDASRIVKGLSADSRLIQKDYIFAAISGRDTDGHNYIDQAIENGAIAIIGETPPKTAISCPFIN